MVAAYEFCIAYVIVDALCLTLTVIIASNISRDSGSELQVRFFFLLLSANLLFDIFDATWAILVVTQASNTSNLLLSFVNGINLLSIAAAGYFWLCFSLAHFESPVVNKNAALILTAIPAVSVVIFHVIGYFTGQNVVFSADGTIEYGAMHTINSIVPLFYLLAATTLAIHEFRTTRSHAKRHTSLVFMLFMLPPATAGIFDMIIPNMPIAAAGMMIAIVFVMMSLQEARISNDALTGLNNRRRAESYLEESVSHATAEQPVYLFIIDMDDFKAINDTYGHLEGDRALQLMAEALRSVCGQLDVFAARWGGDEFVVIGAKGPLPAPGEVIALINNTLLDKAIQLHLDYHLACSVGYSVCKSPAETRERLVADADDMLYRNKPHNR